MFAMAGSKTVAVADGRARIGPVDVRSFGHSAMESDRTVGDAKPERFQPSRPRATRRSTQRKRLPVLCAIDHASADCEDFIRAPS